MDKIITKIIQQADSTDIRIICHTLDIDIIEIELGNIFGFKTTKNRIHTIYVNINLSEKLKQFIIGHELGHCLLHKNISTPFFRNTNASTSFISKLEREANLFSIKLLTNSFEYFENCTIQYMLRALEIPKELYYLFEQTVTCIHLDNKVTPP